MCCRYFSKTNNPTKTDAQPLKSGENFKLLNEDYIRRLLNTSRSINVSIDFNPIMKLSKTVLNIP